MATLTRWFRTLSKDSECTYYHNQELAQVSEKRTSFVSWSYYSWSYESRRSRSNVSNEWRDREIFCKHTSWEHPMKTRLCYCNVYLFYRSPYFWTYNTKPQWCKSWNHGICSSRKVRKTPSCISHRWGSWCDTGISYVTWWSFCSTFYSA